MIPLVLTYVGDDRPGLINAVSEKIAAFGGTWLESRSARLAGKFAGILRVNVPEENAGARTCVARPRDDGASPDCRARARTTRPRRRRVSSRSTFSATSGPVLCAT